ncbi:hypothetical protein R1sor_017591 [Riccia sorocarpa]|uniref:Tetratricopeptide repeat protein n=1 Tax=Riccia sorocarpa TaxID=122646 RepID=A0ABD3IAL6_9MARC
MFYLEIKYIRSSIAAGDYSTTFLFTLQRNRRRLERTSQSRQHFVKAATLFNEAQKTKDQNEAESLAEQAIVEVDDAIRLDKDDPSFHILKSLALEIVGNSKGAVKELDRALKSPRTLTVPERSVTMVKKAELLLSQPEDGENQIQEAVADLRRSVELTPRNVRAKLLLGKAYEKDGNIPKAIETFNAAATLDPNSPDAKEALERLHASSPIAT